MKRKKNNTIGLLVFLVCYCIAGCGCSTNMFKKGAGGAAAGAVSASFVGALTDLIVDGRVNTYRLSRNLVGGAIAGGTAGAVVGHQQDVREEQKKQAAADARLREEIGSDNFNALVDLLNYRYEDAYAKTLRSTRSGNRDYQAGGFAIQALIDGDRGNEEGMNEALASFVEVSNKADSVEDARKGLGELGRQLKDERKVQGIRKPK